MSTLVYSALFVLATLGTVIGQEIQDSTLILSFFGSSTCGECLEIKNHLLKPLEEEYDKQLTVRYYDTETDTGLALLLQMEKEYGVQNSASQVLFFPDTFLSGFADIMRLGRRMVAEDIESGSYGTSDKKIRADTSHLSNVLADKAQSWGFFLGTLATGLVDGINPCAIATMIFLISFLATRKRNRTEILLIGITYTGAVFITYFAMGMGLKGVLEGLSGYHIVSKIIRWGAFIVAAGVALFSFIDAYRFHKTKNTQDIALQLPKAVKLRIHKVISGNLSGTSLFIGALVTGFLVTLLEAICTGQMYIPYIVAMTQRESLRIRGIVYLLFYNFLFVLPLLIVMILAYYGLKWNELAKRTQKSMVFLKVLFGIVMTGLAVYIVTAGKMI